MLISSLQNPKIKLAESLKERRDRNKSGLFIIEGYREIKRAVDAKRTIQTLFVCPELFLGSNEQALIDSCNCQILVCTKQVFSKISYRDRPDGLLAIAPQHHLTITDLEKLLKPNPFILIAESIEKPGNLGTILRSCDAAGVDAVIVCDPTTDIHNPNVVRASIGTLFTLPVIEASTTETIQFIRSKNISIVSATPHAEKEFTQVDLTVPLAIVVGTEQYGLSENWMKQSDLLVKIPMCGIADSLNVASATTLMLYEALRQRRSHLLR